MCDRLTGNKSFIRIEETRLVSDRIGRADYKDIATLKKNENYRI